MLLMAAMLLCWTACSNDNDSPVDADDEDDVEYVEETEPMTRQDSLNIAAMSVINALCTDSTSTEPDANGKYIPQYGSVLYDMTPTVRYKVAESAEDAKGQFLLSFATAIAFVGVNNSGDAISLDFGDNGSVEFEPAQGEGKLGILHVDMPQIPSLTQVVWLQAEAWPHNDGNGGTYVGQTFKSRDGKRWVCIQTSEGGSEYGLLVTFDNTDGLTKLFDPRSNSDGGVQWGYHVERGDDAEKYWQSWLHYGYASSADLKSLNRFMYNQGGATRNVKAEEIFSNTAFMSAEMYNAIYQSGKHYCCGDNSWHYRTSNEHKYYYYRYSSRKKSWVTDGSVKDTYYFMGNRWYIMYANWRNSFLRDDRWDSYNCYHIAGHQYNIDGGHTNDYDVNNFRNYYKSSDHLNYIKVQAYHFNGSFYNEQTGQYANGEFTNWDITGRR